MDGEPPALPTWRRRPATAVVAAAVTVLIAGPMLVLALGAGPAERVRTDGIRLADAAGGDTGLDGATLPAVSAASIIVDVEATAVAWVLAPAGEAAIARGADRSPPFVVEPDLGRVADGRYELLVTAIGPDGAVIRRAARFAIGGELAEAAS